MRHFSAIVLFLIVLLVAVSCAPEGYYGTQTAEAPDSTPTRETVPETPVPTATDDGSNLWNEDCLSEDQETTVYNTNPCMDGRIAETHYGKTQERPMQYGLVFEPSLTGQERCVDMWYDNGFVVNATMCSGGIGFSIPLVYPGNDCNLLIVRGDSTINVPTGEEEVAADNFSIVATAYTENGERLSLGEGRIATEWQDGFNVTHYNLSNQNKEYLFPFVFEDPNIAIRIEVVFRSIWASGNHGSTFIFRDIILVHPDDPGNCANAQGF